MAEYWIKYIDDTTSEKVNKVEEIKKILKDSNKYSSNTLIFSCGQDIDFENFFGQQFPDKLECIVYKSNINNCLLEANSNRNGYSNPITFFECEIENIQISGLSLGYLSFDKCTVNRADISNCSEIKKINISKESQIGDLNIKYNKEIYSFLIDSKSKIKSIELNNSSIIDVILKESILENLTSIKYCSFNNFSLNNCQINSINIFNTPIAKELVIVGCQENSSIDFKLCRFTVKEVKIENSIVNINFNKVRTKDKILFRLNESQKSYFHFNRCYFADEVLFQGNIFENNRNLLINECVFKNLVLFDNDNANSLVIKESLFQDGILLPLNLKETQHHFSWWCFMNRIKTYLKNKRNWEKIHSSVWCTLKNQALSRNDKINALEYRRYEMNSYAQELKEIKSKNQEKIVLLLNRISNNHGQSWTRGALFTLISWIGFYSLFTMSRDSFRGLNFYNCHFLLSDNTFWTEAINFLWIPHSINILIDGLETDLYGIFKIFMAIFFFLGKILIAYGIVQTISAFRKHGNL
ncbi:MAG: hypothetical protein JXA16_15045 [Bacteroidales bacterium]|nr:hypothetical protein [Bacteroidales bacterium]